MTTMHHILLLQGSIMHGYYPTDITMQRSLKYGYFTSDITTEGENKAWLLTWLYHAFYSSD